MLAQEYIQKYNEPKKVFDYEIVGSESHLAGFKKINIFVGSNNSGKSRFLRQMYTSNDEKFVFFENVSSKLVEVYQVLSSKYANGEYHSKEVLQQLRDLVALPGGDFINRFNSFYKKLNDDILRYGSFFNELKRELVDRSILDAVVNKPQKHKRIYIPILRGLRHLESRSENNSFNDFYQKTTNAEYQFAGDFAASVFTGLSIYAEIKKMLLGSQEDRELVRKFETFLSKSFFLEKTITLIPDHDKSILKLNIQGENDRFIYEIGDGIQSIIINTFKAFQYQEEELMLFVEEPELMMHPSVQRVLIETFVKDFPKLQVFLTTHSNHFLDLTYDYPKDVAIYSFEKSESKFYIKNIGVNAKILDLLGVRNSSVFLSNCVIWTEGVTDRMILRKLLSICKCHFKEDFHYSFAEYGGSNLENFDFNENEDSNGVNINSISKTNFLIADNDDIKAGDIKKHNSLILKRREKIKSILGEDNFFDNHLEIENLIPFKVWHQVIELILKEKPDKGICLKPIDEINGEIFDKELNEKKIGILLKEYLIKLKDKKFDYYINDNIKCLGLTKKEVMKYVIEAIDELKVSIEDFSKETQSLIGSLIRFIGNANKKP